MVIMEGELPDIRSPEDTEHWGEGENAIQYKNNSKLFQFCLFFNSPSSQEHLQVRGLSPALLGFLLHASE